MTHSDHGIHVFINQVRHSFQHREQTGRAIKEHADILPDHILCLKVSHHQSHEECGNNQHGEELKVIDDDQVIMLEDGQHFWSHPTTTHAITVTINRKEFVFSDSHQTGRMLKERAGIPLTDVLFRHQANEDEVVVDDAKIELKCGDCFHSAPPANYGAPPIGTTDVGFDQFDSMVQPDNWTFLVVPNYLLPDSFFPKVASLLVKLPPSFPDAAPDMFWLHPQVRTASGGAPQGTSIETLLDEQWQRFSWHLLPGAWRPGISTLRDYMRCIRARLEKRD